MSPDSIVFGRMTVGNQKISLGQAPTGMILTRAGLEIRKIKHRAEMIIQIEMSPTKLPDSTTFDRQSQLEQEFAGLIMTDLSAESPFPGLSLGRVVEVMETPEFIAYQTVCEPNKRLGLTERDIEKLALAYKSKYPDVAEHLPKWIE